MTMTDGESADAFLQRLRQAASRIDYGDKQIRNKFLDSLPHDCQSAILMTATDKTTTEEFAAKAQLFFDLNKTSRPTTTKEVTFVTQDELNRLSEEVSSLKMTNKHHDRQDSQSRGRSRERRPHTPRFDRSATRSSSRNGRDNQYTTDRHGRSPYRYDNRHDRPRQRQQSRSRTIICDYCRIPGHVWRDCRKRQRDMRRLPPPSHQPPYYDYGKEYQSRQNYYQPPPPPPPHGRLDQQQQQQQQNLHTAQYYTGPQTLGFQ